MAGRPRDLEAMALVMKTTLDLLELATSVSSAIR